MSPRSEEQNSIIKDERREQILSAALKVFAVGGFAATKISHIAKEGNISHGLVYHYFKSKEEIFHELVVRAIFYSGQTLKIIDDMQLSPVEKVRKTAQAILGGIAQGKETSYYFLIVVHASVMETTVENNSYLSGVGKPMDIMSRILTDGQEKGEIKDGDPSAFSTVFFSAILGLAVYKLIMPDFEMPDPEILVNMVKK